jgi:hypothetical protein
MVWMAGCGMRRTSGPLVGAATIYAQFAGPKSRPYFILGYLLGSALCLGAVLGRCYEWPWEIPSTPFNDCNLRKKEGRQFSGPKFLEVSSHEHTAARTVRSHSKAVNRVTLL